MKKIKSLKVLSEDDLDSPERTLMHKEIIQKNLFLKKLYIDFYSQFSKTMPDKKEGGFFVELGSGGGFIKEIIPQVVTSDIMLLPHVDQCFSAMQMPFANQSVERIFMINVFHHINQIELFLEEVNRCLKKGGKMVMIEPANTLFSRFIYQNFHHEPFDSKAGWSFESKGPLSSANGALPSIVFERDVQIFEKKFPELRVVNIKHHTPFRYLLSGGLSYPQLVPGFLFDIVTFLEKLFFPLNRFLGMFMTVEVEKG